MHCMACVERALLQLAGANNRSSLYTMPNLVYQLVFFDET
jgi:hypothetical protein